MVLSLLSILLMYCAGCNRESTNCWTFLYSDDLLMRNGVSRGIHDVLFLATRGTLAFSGGLLCDAFDHQLMEFRLFALQQIRVLVDAFLKNVVEL